MKALRGNRADALLVVVNETRFLLLLQGMTALEIANTKKHQYVANTILTKVVESGIRQGFDTEMGGIGSFVNKAVSCPVS